SSIRIPNPPFLIRYFKKMPCSPYIHNYEDVFNFIVAYKQLHDGNSPTWREIGSACNISSVSVVAYILKKLEAQGKIILEHNSLPRKIIIVGGRWVLEKVSL
ncbi:unnamed protein product, partial [marine sediment metagenome]